MNNVIKFSVMFGLACASIGLAQQQSAFPLGILTYSGSDVNYTQMSDTLLFNWIQGHAGQTAQLEPIVRNNTKLNVMAIEDSISGLSSGQRMMHKVERHEALYYWFLTHNMAKELDLLVRARHGDIEAEREPEHLKRFLLKPEQMRNMENGEYK